MAASHKPATQYYKESHGSMVQPTDKFATAVRGNQQNRYRQQMEALKAKREDVLFHESKKAEWAAEKRALESGQAPGPNQRRLQLALTEHPIRQKMGTYVDRQPSGLLESKYRTDPESLQEIMSERDLVGVGRRMRSYPSAQRQGLFASLAPQDARLLAANNYQVMPSSSASTAPALHAAMAMNRDPLYQPRPRDAELKDAHPGLEVDYTSQLVRMEQLNSYGHSKLGASTAEETATDRPDFQYRTLTSAWTGEMRPSAEGQQTRVTSINQEPTVPVPASLLQGERPAAHMNPARLPHVSFLAAMAPS